MTSFASSQTSKVTSFVNGKTSEALTGLKEAFADGKTFVNRANNNIKQIILPQGDLALPGGGKIPGGSHYLDDVANTGKNVSNMVGDGTDDFIGTLRGESVHLKDVKIEKIKYVKRTTEELKKLRNKFNSSVRKQFAKTLAENEEILRKAGLNETDIVKLKNGRIPDGWQVHHKLPLDDNGTNDFDNLVLIKNEPWHKVITNHQNSIAKGMKASDIKNADWPIIEGNIYPKLKE